MNLVFAKELAEARHAVAASVGNGLDQGGVATAVEPDLVGQIRRQADIALALGAVAGGTAGAIVDSLAAIGLRRVRIDRTGQRTHIVGDVLDLLRTEMAERRHHRSAALAD